MTVLQHLAAVQGSQASANQPGGPTGAGPSRSTTADAADGWGGGQASTQAATLGARNPAATRRGLPPPSTFLGAIQGDWRGHDGRGWNAAG